MAANPPLTRSENPGPPVGVDKPIIVRGNYADDDPVAIDQYFEAADQLPEDFLGLQVPHEDVPETTRIVRRRYTLTNQFQAVQALPADPRRKHLYLYAFSAVVGSFASYGGEYFAANGAADNTVNASLISLPTAGLQVCITLDDYSGPLYIANYDVNAIFFDVVAITQ